MLEVDIELQSQRLAARSGMPAYGGRHHEEAGVERRGDNNDGLFLISLREHHCPHTTFTPLQAPQTHTQPQEAVLRMEVERDKPAAASTRAACSFEASKIMG